MIRNNRIVTITLIAVAVFGGYIYSISMGEKPLGAFNMNDVVGVVAILSGIAGIVMGIASARQASLEAVKEYFQQGDEDAYVEARRRIFNEKGTITEADLSKVANFFHFWGLMNRKGYLPIWVFEGSSGIQIVKLYQKLEPNILEKRCNNIFYAVEFELLVKRISKKYKKNLGMPAVMSIELDRGDSDESSSN